MVRTKFKITSKQQSGPGFRVTASPVVRGSEENDSFYVLTPAGILILDTINQAAADQLVEGNEYYIDLTPAVD